MDAVIIAYPGVELLRSKRGDRNWLSLNRDMGEDRIRDHAYSTCEGDDPPEEEWLSAPDRKIHVQPSLQQSLVHRLQDVLLRQLRTRDPRAVLHIDHMSTAFGHTAVPRDIQLNVRGRVTDVDDGEFVLVTIAYEIYGVTERPLFQTGSITYRYQPG